MIGIEFKRGDTLMLRGISPAQPGGYSGWTLASEVRQWGPGDAPGALVATLECEWSNASSGEMLIRSTLPTNAWPLGLAVFDVRYVAPGAGGRTTSSYVKFQIIEAATRG